MKLKLLFILLIISEIAFASFDFSNELISDGDYYRALSILKEIEFKQRGNKLGYTAQKKILEVHFKAQDMENFDTYVKKLILNYSLFFQNANLNEISSETEFFLGNYGLAFKTIIHLDTTLEKKYFFRAYAESKDDLPRCNTPTCERIKEIEAQINVAKSSKSEKLALLFGIIPGMGQVYAGNITSGIATFILNSLFISTSIIAFNNNETAMGIASTAIGSTFYLSSIYAGYETTRRYNESQVRNTKSKLKDVMIDFQLLKIIFE